MCVKLSILQERDYGEPALLQVCPHLYRFVPKSLDLFPYHRAVFFSCPSHDIICDKMIFSHANPAVLKMHDLCGMSNAKPLRYSSLNLTSLTQFCAILRLYLALPSNFSLSQKLQQYYKRV